MAESGHVININNLKKAVDFAVVWGADYAPSNPILDISAMTALIASAEATMNVITTKKTPYRNATAACDDAFDRSAN